MQPDEVRIHTPGVDCRSREDLADLGIQSAWHWNVETGIGRGLKNGNSKGITPKQGGSVVRRGGARGTWLDCDEGVGLGGWDWRYVDREVVRQRLAGRAAFRVPPANAGPFANASGSSALVSLLLRCSSLTADDGLL